MDILQQQYNNNQKPSKTTAQKMILKLIIISVILFILLLAVLLYSKSKPKVKTISLNVDDTEVQITQTLLLDDTNGKKYISLQEIAPLIEYKFYNGEYLKYAEDKTKCYLESATQVVGFEQNSKKTYKKDINSDKDYKYYNLSNVVFNNNGILYIALEDVQTALDVYTTYSVDTAEIKIYTTSKLVNQYKEALAKKSVDYAVETSSEKNNKAVLDEMLVISSNSKFGVINTKGETLIGTKYNNLQYEEYTKEFIASNANNKYGIITKEGTIKIDFNYDSIEILNYEPILYKVKKNDLYGIADEKGNLISEIKYSNFGFKENESSEMESALIIKDLNIGNTGLIVNQNGKYGLISITTGNEILPCELSKIYAKTNAQTDKKEYYVEVEGSKYLLQDYIAKTNTITVQM